MKLIDAEAFAQRTHERFNRKSEALVIGTSGYTGDLTDMEYFDRWLDQQPEIEAEPANTWINVEDRLPEHEVEVLVNEVDVGIMTGWYDARDKVFKGEEFNKLEVTHWQPLPEPPKDGDTNG